MDVQGIWKTLTSWSTCLWFHYLGHHLQVWEWKTGGDPGSSHHAAAGHLQDWGAKGTSCGMASDEVNYSLPFQSSVTRKLFSSTSLTKQNNKISELKEALDIICSNTGFQSCRNGTERLRWTGDKTGTGVQISQFPVQNFSFYPTVTSEDGFTSTLSVQVQDYLLKSWAWIWFLMESLGNALHLIVTQKNIFK